MNQKKSVPGMSRAQIRDTAREFLKAIGLENTIGIPIVHVLESLNNSEFITMEIVNKAEMTEEAIAIPNEMYLKVREDVYEKAISGNHRSRFTIAHELGHIILHKGIQASYARNGQDVPAYKDPEWQADCFAGELLVSARLCKNMTPVEISMLCGVSPRAAEIQYKNITK